VQRGQSVALNASCERRALLPIAQVVRKGDPGSNPPEIWRMSVSSVSAMASSWALLAATWHRMSKDSLSILAAGIAFQTFFSLFPTLTAVVSLYGRCCTDRLAVASEGTIGAGWDPVNNRKPRRAVQTPRRASSSYPETALSGHERAGVRRSIAAAGQSDGVVHGRGDRGVAGGTPHHTGRPAALFGSGDHDSADHARSSVWHCGKQKGSLARSSRFSGSISPCRTIQH
jgi:hypothetical protein